MASDWYNIVEIAPGVHAIGEPRYEQQNWSYLIEGAARALLFDSGSYFGNIAPIVADLTDLPLTVLPSHMHYDHLGNIHRFETIHLPDLPVLRACAVNGLVTPTETLFLGEHENRQPPGFRVAEWLVPGTRIDLGDRHLDLLHTPGHSPDSVSLWLVEDTILLAADFLYPGELYAQVPGASLPDYLATTRTLLSRVGAGTRIFGAHGDADDPGSAIPPRLGTPELEALETTLLILRDSAPSARQWLVSDRLTLITSPEAFGRWHTAS